MADLPPSLPPSPQPAPARRWTRALLFASLALNLAVVGIVAGLALKGPPGPPMGTPGMDPGLRGFAEALPEPFRRELGRSLRESRGDWTGPRERARKTRAALAAALTADPYDPGAVTQVLDEGNALLAELGRRGAGLVEAQIARMDATERADYARRLLEPPRGRGTGGDGHGPGRRDAQPDR